MASGRSQAVTGVERACLSMCYNQTRPCPSSTCKRDSTTRGESCEEIVAAREVVIQGNGTTFIRPRTTISASATRQIPAARQFNLQVVRVFAWVPNYGSLVLANRLTDQQGGSRRNRRMTTELSGIRDRCRHPHASFDTLDSQSSRGPRPEQSHNVILDMAYGLTLSEYYEFSRMVKEPWLFEQISPDNQHRASIRRENANYPAEWLPSMTVDFGRIDA